MKPIVLTLALVLAATIPLALAQAPAEKPAEKQAVDVAKIIDRLGAEDFNARKQAEKELLALGEKAIVALEKAAKEHADAHVRLAAEKILKKVRTAAEGEKPLAERGGDERKADPASEYERRLREMLERLEREGRLTEEQLERLRKSLEGQRAGGGSMHGRSMANGRTIDYRRDGEGRIVVKITENGETKTYEADSLEQLKEKHPEVHAVVEKHFGGMRIRTSGLGRDWPGWGDWPGFGRKPQTTPREVPLREREVPGGFRMGIWIGEVSEALRVHLKLPEGEGVLVEDVVKGSLADRIGVKRLDVIRKVNGTPVGSAAEVRTVVEKIAEGGQVTLDTIREGSALTLVGTR